MKISRMGIGGISSPELETSPEIGEILSPGIGGILSPGISGFFKPGSESDFLPYSRHW